MATTTASKATTTKKATTKTAGTKVPISPKKEDVMDKKMNKPVVTETQSGAVKVFEKEFVQAAQKHDKAIKAGFGKASKCFFEIASHLYWIYDNDAFKTFGMDNIYDFARSNYDLSKASVSNYINIVRRFCRPALESDAWILQDAYAAYTPSQLAQMLPAPYTDEVIVAAGINPKMSCRDINKALKAMLPDKRDKSDNALIDDTEDKPSNPVPDTVCTDDSIDDVAPESVRNVMCVIRGSDDYLKRENRMLELIHNLLTKKPCARLEIAFYDN